MARSLTLLRWWSGFRRERRPGRSTTLTLEWAVDTLMSLFYSATEQEYRGKTAEHEDRFTVRFVELEPPARIVQATLFDAVDPAFFRRDDPGGNSERLQRQTQLRHQPLRPNRPRQLPERTPATMRAQRTVRLHYMESESMSTR